MKNNNPLYAEIALLDVDFYKTRIEPAHAPRNDAIGIVRLPDSNEQIYNDENADYTKIPISLPDKDGKKVTQFLDLEKALSLYFPMLFPSGIIPKILWKTLKEKSHVILSSHEFYRCGRLQCSLVLFLYNSISVHNAAFVQNIISLQRTVVIY